MNTREKSLSPAVEALGLSKTYGFGVTEVVAMRNVSVRIGAGEMVALLGPSGSGKSTLLTALGLINPPDCGQIAIGGALALDGGRALLDLPAFRRQRRASGNVGTLKKQAASDPSSRDQALTC